MINTKKRAFSFGALVQTIQNYFTYKKGHLRMGEENWYRVIRFRLDCIRAMKVPATYKLKLLLNLFAKWDIAPFPYSGGKNEK